MPQKPKSKNAPIKLRLTHADGTIWTVELAADLTWSGTEEWVKEIAAVLERLYVGGPAAGDSQSSRAAFIAEYFGAKVVGQLPKVGDGQLVH